VLHDKYEFSQEAAQNIASFLSLMLDLNPEKRAGAAELARHGWLSEEEEAAELTLIISTG
jgi:serine/threonine-protein kinase SRPK3